MAQWRRGGFADAVAARGVLGNQLRPSNQAASSAATDNSIGDVASITGNATVTRGNAGRVALKIADVIYVKDALQTDVNSSLGISFDDETTFSLSANTRIVIDAFVYQQGGSGNNALFNVASGTLSSPALSPRAVT
jgi:hypothetical protein